jgi:WD40 repeat protein
MASASKGGTVKLWDSVTGAIYRTLEGYSIPIYGVVFSPEGKLMASISADGTIILYNSATEATRRTLLDHLGRVNSVVFSLDGSW